MSKLLENEKSYKKRQKKVPETAKYYGTPVKSALVGYFDKFKYGTKSQEKNKLARYLGISVSKLNRCISGYSIIDDYEELKRLSSYLKIPIDNLSNSKQNRNNIERKLHLTIKGISKKYTINGVEVFSNSSCKVLYNHINKKNYLFPIKDSFIDFLDFIISEEDFIEKISSKAQDIFEGFYNAKDVKIISKCNDYKEFKDKLDTIKSNDKELNKLKKKLDDLIMKNLIRRDVKEIITKYIYYKLKKLESN